MQRFIIPALVALIVGYAAFLRLDALFRQYGPFDHPRWVVALQQGVAATRDGLVPRAWDWPRIERPYVGGDPVNYLKYAREMRHFYQAHVREPLFLAATRAMLALTGNQDVAVSFTSLTFSVLWVLATFILGAVAARPAVGILAALMLSLDLDVIGWAPAGWRDDAYAAFVTLSAASLVWMRRHPGWPASVMAGLIGAAACLTRLTAFIFLIPAWAWIVWSGDRASRRARVNGVALSAAVTLALVAPYLVNCYREAGDALLAINYHTRFYQAAELVTSEKPPSAAAYVFEKFQSKPIATTDTVVRGLFVYPFEIKWQGLRDWLRGAQSALAWLSAAGLIAWCFRPTGRVLLVVLLASLVPYMVTWPLRGGGEWRFTMHAYPFYLVAAFEFVFALVGQLIAMPRTGVRPLVAKLQERRSMVVTVTLLMIAAIPTVAVASYWVPYLVARESLQHGESTSISAGPGDGVFFTGGWTDRTIGGNVIARFARGEIATLRVPFPERRPYRLVLRMDPPPVELEPAQRVHVFVGQRDVGSFDLAWDPQRVGSYSLDLPIEAVPVGSGRIALVASSLVPMSQAGNAFPELPRTMRVGFRLWYVRLTPLEMLRK